MTQVRGEDSKSIKTKIKHFIHVFNMYSLQESVSV